jgi:hypothetical protein
MKIRIKFNDFPYNSYIANCDSYEIIDEDKKIEKLQLTKGTVPDHIFEQLNKINELIDAVNKLKEKL